jgi:hypothetical protein
VALVGYRGETAWARVDTRARGRRESVPGGCGGAIRPPWMAGVPRMQERFAALAPTPPGAGIHTHPGRSAWSEARRRSLGAGRNSRPAGACACGDCVSQRPSSSSSSRLRRGQCTSSASPEEVPRCEQPRCGSSERCRGALNRTSPCEIGVAGCCTVDPGASAPGPRNAPAFAALPPSMAVGWRRRSLQGRIHGVPGAIVQHPATPISRRWHNTLPSHTSAVSRRWHKARPAASW